jgi:hypothetical protein
MSVDYFAMPGINWSLLKYMRESPRMYKHRLSVPREDTPALALGRAVHTLVFEPEKFDAEYAIWTGGRRAGNEWNAFQDLHCDQTILRAQDVEMVTQLAEAIARHPLVQPYLDGGEFERVITWTDPDTGLPCKGKPDWILPHARVLLDLKTCVCNEARRFGAMAARYGYHAQLSHYENGIEAGLGWRPKRVLIVAAEKDEPHDVAVFELDPEARYAGHEEVAELMRKVKVCTDTDSWPGRYTDEQALALPAWMFSDESDEDPESFGLVAA